MLPFGFRVRVVFAHHCCAAGRMLVLPPPWDTYGCGWPLKPPSGASREYSPQEFDSRVRWLLQGSHCDRRQQRVWSTLRTSYIVTSISERLGPPAPRAAHTRTPTASTASAGTGAMVAYLMHLRGAPVPAKQSPRAGHPHWQARRDFNTYGTRQTSSFRRLHMGPVRCLKRDGQWK